MRRSAVMRWGFAPAQSIPFLVLCAVVGCASAPQPRQLGEYGALSPRLAVVDSERPPVNLTVNLAAPASVVVMYVAPGRSTRIVYPADTLGAPPLPAGAQRITATWPRPRALGDSVRRDTAIANRRPTASQPRTRRDSLARAGMRTMPALPDPEAGLAPVGYLLLVATPGPLSYREVRRKVEGVTTPLDPTEALNAIAKQVSSTLDPSVPWAGYALEVTAHAEERRGPPRNPRTGL